MKNYLAIDQGTTSSRSIVFNTKLEKVHDSQKEYNLSYPDDGWVELNPDDVLNTVTETLQDVLDKCSDGNRNCRGPRTRCNR